MNFRMLLARQIDRLAWRLMALANRIRFRTVRDFLK